MNAQSNLPALTSEKAGEIMEAVIARGDLAKLDPGERAKYYTRVCDSMGLNPLTKPFDYITLNGKLTLYALKTATDQLRKIYGVSVVDMTEKREGDLIVVTVKVQDATGRTDMAKGALTLKGLQGEALANGIMKAETKAKRRATLSICGLGFLDETEVETIPGARVLKKDHRQDYHAMLAELDHSLAPREWAITNTARIEALPLDWQMNIETVIRAKLADPTVSSGEILADGWADQQAQNLRNATQSHQPPEPPTELWSDEGETPPEWQGDKWEKLGPVAQAGTLCKEPAFWKFRGVANADDAVKDVRAYCNVSSRKELATNDNSGKLWRRLVEQYRAWQREPAIVDEPLPHQTIGRAATDGAPAAIHAPHDPAGAPEVLSLEYEAREAAKRGEDVFKAFYRRTSAADRAILEPLGAELRKLMDEAGT